MAEASWRDRQGGRSYDDVVEELEGRIVALETFLKWDEELRKEHPALQDLFEKFQATKKLVVK